MFNTETMDKFVDKLKRGYVGGVADNNIQYIQSMIKRIDGMGAPSEPSDAITLILIKEDLKSLIKLNEKTKELL